MYGRPTFCAASASGPTGNPTTPNMYCTPCSLRLFASKSAPLISANVSSCEMGAVLQARLPNDVQAEITHLWRAGKWACPAASFALRGGQPDRATPDPTDASK